MFALDLFNNDHERRLAEGAVDQLEQRRIDDLAMKMDDLVARAKDPAYKKNPAALAALMKEFQKCKAERDSYYMVRNETMGYGSLGEDTTDLSWAMGDVVKDFAKKWMNRFPGNPVDTAEQNDDAYEKYADLYIKNLLQKHGVEITPRTMQKARSDFDYYMKQEFELHETGIGQDLVNKTEKMARATPSTPTSKVASTVKNAAKWLAGKGGPGKEGPTYESQKKNSEVTDPVVDRLLTRARREHPQAHSDAEALAMHILNKETNDVDRLDHVNDREDRMIAKLSDLEQNLQKQIDQIRGNKELDEHGGGIGPRQHWQDLMQENKLSVGDPVVVTAPNEFEGKTGEIYEFSPSGTFVIVDLYNHGKHSMHLSDVEYNQYADDQEQDDWYDDADEFGKPGSEFFPEGFQDFNKVEPYAVCLAGKPVKKFDYYEEARRFHDNWKKKLYREGNKEKADKITLMPLNLDEEEQKPAGWGEFPPKQEITIVPPKKLKSGQTYQDQNKYWQSQGQAPIYKTNEGHADQQRKVFKKNGEAVGEVGIDRESSPGNGQWYMKCYARNIDNAGYNSYEEAVEELKHCMKQGVAEDTGSWIVYDPETRQIKKRFKTHTAGKSYARTHGLGFASSEYYFDRVKDNKEVAETALNPRDPAGDYAAKRKALQDLGMNKDVDQQAVLQRRLDLDREAKAKGVNEVAPPGAKAERMVKHIKKAYSKDGKLTPKEKAIAYATTWKAHNDGKVEEGAMSNLHAELSDVYNRMAPGIERNRDSFKAGQLYDALEAVAEQHGAEVEFKRIIAGARNRAHMDYDTNPGGFQNWFWYLPFAEEELSEEQDTSAVERAILNRIMVAHTDLLMKFGPEKVMQAAEEVAYNVGDVDEIGTSDVSAYVHQVKQILGVPEEVNEKWSQKYKSSINCANPKGFSQKAHCAGRKK